MVGPLSIFLAGIVLLNLAGCAGQELYHKGGRLLDAGKYDEAVITLREAAKKNPTDGAYQDRLAEAETLAADHHVARAEKLVNEHRPSEAKKDLDVAIEQMPAHPQAVLMIKTAENSIKQCEQLVVQAQTALKGGKLDEAARLAEQAYNIDKGHAGAQQVRQQARAAALAQYLTSAQQALQARDWDGCKAQCAKIKEFEASNGQADELEKQAAERKEASALFNSAKAASQKEDYRDTIASLQKANELWPQNKEISAELDRIKGLAVSRFVEQANSELSAKRFDAGIASFDQALAVAPERKDLIERRAQAHNLWVSTIMDKYERLAMAGEWERAWPTAIYASVLGGPTDQRAEQAHLRAERMIRERIAYKLSVLPLPSADVSINDALTICQPLIKTLEEIKPEHVHIHQPANMAQILQAGELSLNNITDPSKLREWRQKLGGADVLLFVDLSVRKSASPNSTRIVSSKLQLRLVEATTGQVLWGHIEVVPLSREADALIEPVGESRGSSSKNEPVKLHDEAMDKLKQVLQTKATEVLNRRSRTYWEDAQKQTSDQAIANYVRFLFDYGPGRDLRAVGLALDEIFSHDVSNKHIEACKQIAIRQLKLQLVDTPSFPSGNQVASNQEPLLKPSPNANRAGMHTAIIPQESKPILKSKGSSGQAIAAKPGAPQRPVPPERSDQRGRTDKTKPAIKWERVFQGTISRHDRYPKELQTIDMITVKVKDTDEDPLDADLEIRVGDSEKKKLKDLRVGARINLRGASGGQYQLVILQINDDKESVHFSLESASLRP